jgi:hypothetical protein
MSLSTLLAAMALIAAGGCAASAFTEWGKRRPLHRYGALSISAHLLLVAAMAGIRVGGPPRAGAEEGPMVKVRVVLRTVETADPKAEAVAPVAEAEKATSKMVVEEPSPVVAEPAPAKPQAVEVSQPEPVKAPPLPEPEKAPELAKAEPLAPPDVEKWALEEEVQEPEQAPEPPPQAATRETVQVEAQPEPPLEPIPQPELTPVPRPSSADPTEAGPSSLAPSAYAQRGELAKRQLSADQGGSQESLDAVAAAVDWLARAQAPNGSWDSKRWGAGHETHTLGQDRKGAGAGAETGLSALALLAMGGAGHTHLAGPYRDVVTRGLQFLLDEQETNGSLAGDATLYAKTYCHSMSTFALAEAMAVSGDERLRPAVEAAVGYLVRTQSRSDGGWRYQPGDRGDMSQMGWIVMALRSAEIAGVHVPETTWAGCEKFMNSVRRGEHGGLACYQQLGPTTSTMTAEAMYCRQILGVARREPAANGEAAAWLLTDLPGTGCRSCPGGKPNLYYWYYATLALHHHRSTGAAGEQSWNQWNDAMQRAILPRQVAQGPEAGSWGPDTVWGGYGGRVYSTSMAAMSLEVYYRYNADSIGRDPWIASREGALRR